jgi:FkbM family methyltransferase
MPDPYLVPDAKLEAALAPYFHPDMFFVNVGASDGLSNDPVYPFIRKYGWRGLLVEPVPHVFAMLRRNYAEFPGMLFDNTLVASSPGTFHHLPEDYCRAHPWACQIGSLDLERVRWAMTYIATKQVFPGARFEDLERITAVELPCVSFPELLARHAIEQFDVLNLDTEGTDLEILESVELARFRVRAAVIETRPKYHDDRITALLAEQGFEFVSTIDWATDAFVRRG